jgi:hypothetical protein
MRGGRSSPILHRILEERRAAPPPYIPPAFFRAFHFPIQSDRLVTLFQTFWAGFTIGFAGQGDRMNKYLSVNNHNFVEGDHGDEMQQSVAG